MREWLKQARESHGLSQYKVAELAKMSQSYYAAIETGDRGGKLPVETARKIAEVLKFEWTRFYED
ncbi:helix-turn-helix transcriptional regulator [Proteiniclasticum sp. BAD-10]|uniref:Helix-turn-helix transcriptional regulator n=1 Tax=Proteiniclasticum sediminis TaxID=2804028 RepID=A0A941CN84_9CLOT|nr:helix-turn-helix transcriptional regulator [Proteiniclasticum sediminis]MBR0575722.1 helix-turn-helix transcriptional regulator [Proteiniclasticum sediminis]